MLNWDNITTVLLDMDGTLLDLHFDNYFWLHYLPKIYSEANNLHIDQAIKHLHTRFDEEKGKMSWYCLDYWSNELELDIPLLKQDVKDRIAIRPFVIDFLTALKTHKKQVLLVTNAHRGSLDLKMIETKIDPYFDAIISTHDYGLPKEELDLWDILKKNHPFNPESTLLIDDTESVLSSAEKYGIKYLLGIKQPDSKNDIRENLHYPSIHHFSEIMPDA